MASIERFRCSLRLHHPVLGPMLRRRVRMDVGRVVTNDTTSGLSIGTVRESCTPPVMLAIDVFYENTGGALKSNRHFSTGAGAPPPARSYDVASPPGSAWPQAL